jgi:hypothetical protein
MQTGVNNAHSVWVNSAPLASDKNLAAYQRALKSRRFIGWMSIIFGLIALVGLFFSRR